MKGLHMCNGANASNYVEHAGKCWNIGGAGMLVDERQLFQGSSS